MSKINSNKKAVDSLKAAAKEQKSQLAEIYKGALKDLKPVLESLQYVVVAPNAKACLEAIAVSLGYCSPLDPPPKNFEPPATCNTNKPNCPPS